MTPKSEISTTGDTGALRVATLVSICVIALATATALPIGLGDHGITVKAAYAGNGNGNSGNNGKDTAPGQQKQLADDPSAGDEDAVTSIAEGTGGEIGQQAILPIAEDIEPATNKVIKELAGLSEELELSEEEEQEAIRSGWETWRTADGPETVITQ